MNLNEQNPFDIFGNVFNQIDVLEKLNKANKIAIFGAGAGGRRIKNVLNHENVEINTFYDNDMGKWGQNIDGVSISPPYALYSENNGILVCIASDWAVDIAKQLKKMSIQNYIDLTCFYGRWKKNYNLKEIFKAKKSIKGSYKLFDDAESKKVFLSIIKYRMTLDPLKIHISKYNSYFHPLVKPEKNDIIIDAGAHFGETAIKYSEYLKNKLKIFSLEPDISNYQSLLSTVDKGLINCYPRMIGLWDKSTSLSFSTNTDVSSQFHISEGGNANIKTVSLDEFVKKENIIPNLIKMDIEGAEIKAIAGAKETITSYKPKLQICVYHEPDDLWEIPLAIKKLNPNYKLYLGHHNQSLFETTLYAK